MYYGWNRLLLTHTFVLSILPVAERSTLAGITCCGTRLQLTTLSGSTTPGLCRPGRLLATAQCFAQARARCCLIPIIYRDEAHICTAAAAALDPHWVPFVVACRCAAATDFACIRRSVPGPRHGVSGCIESIDEAVRTELHALSVFSQYSAGCQ